MIYTITFNPAVDLVIQVDQCQLGELNRSKGEAYVAGGKGINVSLVLQRLGHVNYATGFVGGFTGQYIKDTLIQEGVKPLFVEVDGITRVNVKVKSQEETEINAAGPQVSPEKFAELMAIFERDLSSEDVVFLAGNAAPGLDVKAYTAIAKLCQERGAKFVLDTNKQLLTECLPYRPFVIKPNHHELGEIFGVSLKDEAEIIHYAKKLQELGARHIIVSRGGEGALLLTEDGQVFSSDIPKGTVVNSVGAGDSMLAGFVATYLETGDFAQSLKRGAATGSATAYSVWIAERQLIDDLVDQIHVVAH